MQIQVMSYLRNLAFQFEAAAYHSIRVQFQIQFLVLCDMFFILIFYLWPDLIDLVIGV